MTHRKLLSLQVRCLALIVLLATGLSGCGKKGVPLYPAKGSVTIGGRPAGKVMVLLVSTDANVGPEATRPYATTAEDGSFQLTTKALNDGAPAGEYKVQLLPAVASPLMSKGKKVTIPADYMDIQKTPLRVTIAPNKGGQTLPVFECPEVP
jgi:hypothetical protein